MTRLLLFGALLLAQGNPGIPERSGTVAGRILRPDGTPAAGVRVSAIVAPDVQTQNLDVSAMGLAETDANGRYRLENVPPGRYHLTAGAMTTPSYFPGVASRAAATIVTVTSGGALSGIDFSIIVPLRVRVSGHVTLEDGAPIQGLVVSVSTRQVRLISDAGFVASSSLTDAGAFEFSNVLPGTYRLGIGSAQVSLVLDRDIADLKILALWNETSGTLSLVLNSAIPPPSAPRRAHEKEPAAARGKETSPQILSQIQPTYTEPARSARLEGSVPLVIKVLKDGSVDPDIRVLSPIGLGLDEQAIAAVSRWKFKPGTNSAGSPVDAFLAIEILFQLK